ncbi:MAG: type III secretion inner membrane ring lipoprotein SctJ [Hyphomicrobiales bacterium]|nr:type III secretion inner membrane ring lipoprotein SctJ [Hyphomicrobiales bacterium]
MTVQRRKINLLQRLCVISAVMVTLTGCKIDLYTKLSETEANEMIAVLVKNGLAANRVSAKDGTSMVQVDESSFSDAVTIVSNAGLPRPRFVTMGDVFADNKLVSSPVEERARFIYAQSQELSKTLSEIDGVTAARVHLVLPKNDPLREEDKPSSASVFIKHYTDVQVALLLPQIKTLVKNSIEGLTYDKVSVVFVPSERPVQIAGAAGEAQKRELFATGRIPAWVLQIGGILGWVVAIITLIAWRRNPASLPMDAQRLFQRRIEHAKSEVSPIPAKASQI